MLPAFDSGLFIDTQSFLRDQMAWEWSHPPVLSNYFQEEIYLKSSALFERAWLFSTQYQAQRTERLELLRRRLKGNFDDFRTDRLRGLSAVSRITSKRVLRELAALIHNDDSNSEEICEALNSATSYVQRLAFRHINAATSLDIHECTDCGTFVTDDQWEHDNNDHVICRSCLDDNYRYSECMGTYITEDNAYRVYDSASAYYREEPDDYCTYRYGSNNFNNFDSVFFSDSDAYYEASDDDDDDCFDEDDRRRNSGLQAYHNGYRDFTEINASGKFASLGMELEIYCEERRDLVSSLKSAFGNQLILERDGSLDDEYGFEIITKPYGREEWAKFAPSLIDVVHSENGIGYNDPAGDNYGIHITVHRRFLSPLAEARIAMFLVDSANADFVRAIAQRNQIYSAHHGVGIGSSLTPTLRVVSSENCHRHNERTGTRQRKMYGRGKYCPVNFKEDLAEFRIFQSTTNLSSIMKNLEFIWALIAWTKAEAATGSSHCHKDFLKWLNTPQQRKEFPHLTTFLSKRVFYGTNFTPIISSWQSLMRKPVETEAIEPMAA